MSDNTLTRRQKNRKIIKRKIINMSFLLVLSIIMITTYYIANFSKAKPVVDIEVSVFNSDNEEEVIICTIDATQKENEDSYYIRLPEYVENRKVASYIYCKDDSTGIMLAGETEIATATETEIETETDTAIETETDTAIETETEIETETGTATEKILPSTKFYLTDGELESKKVEISAIYDTKEVDGTILYNQITTNTINDTSITIYGYMPDYSSVDIAGVDIEETESLIREKTNKPITLAAVYDIKVNVDDEVYEPYEFGEDVSIQIGNDNLKDMDIGIWHITDNKKVEKIELKNNLTFTTDGFSVFALEDTEATALAISEMSDNALVIDDRESDINYWQGKNYTDDKDGSESARGTNQGIYTNFAEVTINYYGYKYNETDPEKIGYISLTERYNVITYKKTIPIINGNVEIELIDNPFIDKPTGYGFGGWNSSDGTITTDSNTNVQTLTATGSSNMTINIYAVWETATVVYLNPDTGNDNVNDGLTEDSPLGSWGAACEYLYNNSTDKADRELNIIVLTGNIDTGINYTNSVTGAISTLADVTYTSSTTFTSGGTYILATGTGSGSNAITANGTSVTNTTLSDSVVPPETAQWIITSSGNGYTIQNLATGYYLVYNNGLSLQSSSSTWTLNNRRFYYRNGNRSYYIRYNNGWTTTTTQNSGTQFYFVTYTSANETEGFITTKGSTESNSYYTSSTNIALTVTSLYNHTDYRESAVMTLPSDDYGDIKIYSDFQIDYVDINCTGYTGVSGGSSVDSLAGNYPILYGNGFNVRIGRGMYPISNTDSDATTITSIYGGSTSTTVGSTSNDDNAYKLVIETGRYSWIQGFHGSGSNNYYGTIYTTWGNDIDRVNNVNDQMETYYRITMNYKQGVIGRSDTNNPAFIINVKSGSYGMDFIELNPTSDDVAYAGIYVGGYGSSTGTTVRDISDRYLIVEGGNIANIVGGLKCTEGSNVDTRIYVKGGTILNIVGGAGLSTSYGDRIVQVTGGTIKYSVTGGSNGVYATTSGSDGKIEDCDILVYVGGTAQIGSEDTMGEELYGVESGCVLGAGDGNTTVSGSGQVDNTHIIIDGNAHILNSIYGGGNYGIVGSSSDTKAIVNIDILGGTIDGNVYGGANNNNIYGSTTINVKAGHILGAIYGGSNTSGTISTTTTINVTGGNLGQNSKSTNDATLFGGGYGQNTAVTGNAIVNILDTDGNVTIYGSVYGGSSQGAMNSNIEVNIQDLPTEKNTISITGNVFAGGKGSEDIATTIAGDVTINVDGCELPNANIFGGNDLNGVTSGTITVNIGKTYLSKVYAVYGGGNEAEVTTATKGVYVYLLGNAEVTNAFNGGKSANLLSSGESDTTRAIYLQGGTAVNVFGGSDTLGTVTASHVYIESGTATNVYGGNNEGGTTITSNVFIQGGNIINVYGGGLLAETTTSNVSLTDGTIENGFGGGSSADVETSSIILSGATAENIYGGSNQDGTVSSSHVAINSGTVQEVFGGNNAGGNTINTEVIVNGSANNVYGGGNNAQTTGNTSVTLSNANITGNVFGGGNGETATVTGDSLTISEGTTTIGGDLFGGGNAAITGSETSTSVVTLDISGLTIGGDIYGAANTSQVFGETHTNIGENVVQTQGLEKNNVSIGGTVFGGGKSNSAGSEDYDFTFESVVGNTYIDIDALGYDDGTYTFTIGESVFGAGNAATMTGNGYVNISNYGTADNPKQNISIQRVTTLTLDNCGILLEGTTDRTNEISTAVYSFNRIKELIIKNNTTLYLLSGANILETLKSVDSSDNKATVTIGETGVISRNVDNRIYLSQGKNLILQTELGAHGEVSGMTYIGMFRGRTTRDLGIYDQSINNGDAVPTDYEEFTRNSYVQGKHYIEHDIQVDGFYTNYDEEGVIETRYIIPTPEEGIYYQWILGGVSDDIFYENIELIATKYATTGAYVLSLDGLNNPNMVIHVMEIDTSDLVDRVILKDENSISNIEEDKEIANNQFSLTMTAGNIGWQSKGTTEFFRQSAETKGTISGTEEFLSDNSNLTPTFSFYLGHSKNISENKALGTITIKLQATYVEDSEETGEQEVVIKNVYIILTISTNNTSSLASDYYEGAITPGKKYSMFPTTNTSITNKSSFSAYYSLYLGDYSSCMVDGGYYDNFVGYFHCLVTTGVLPTNTKITLIDNSADQVKYYYYITTEEDEQNEKTEFKFNEFIAMGSTDEPYNADQSYYNEDLDLVYEDFIIQVDFEDATLEQSLEESRMVVQLRDMWDDTVKVTVNTDLYPMLFNVYSDKEAVKSVEASSTKSYIYLGESFSVDLKIKYNYQTVNSVIVYDTRNFEDCMGIKIVVLDGSTELDASDLSGVYIEYGGTKYYARSDGSYRIKIADAISNINTSMTFHTENADMESKTYTFKFEMFGSFDGIYYSSTIASDSLNMQIINTNYGLIAELDSNSVLIDRSTGKNKNNSNLLEFNIDYSGEFSEPKISVSLYRRSYDTVYISDYDLVDLADYVSDALTETDVESEYLVTDSPQDSQKFSLRLKQNLRAGTYKFVFTLYDGDNYIGDVEKMIIIKDVDI